MRDDMLMLGGWVAGEAAGRAARRRLLAMSDVARGYTVLGAMAGLIALIVCVALVF